MRIEYFLFAMVIAAAVSDIASRRIPNALVLPGLVVALMLQMFVPDAGGWKTFILGGMTGLGLFLPFYLLRGMGAGDVKLMATVGAFVGPLLALKIALLTFLLGGVWALAVIVVRGNFGFAMNNLFLIVSPILNRIGLLPPGAGSMRMRSIGHLPYGVAIALGTIGVMLFQI